VEAARLITQRLPERPPTFLAIGEFFDRQYVEYLKGLVEKYRLDNFHFLGWQPNPSPYYQLADVIVLPTVERERLDMGGVVVEVRGNEGLPRAVLEAMYFGKP